MPPDELYDELPVVKYRAGKGFERIEDRVIKESSIRILLNGREIVAILALKRELEELAVGFLYNECIINDAGAIEEVVLNEPLDAVMVETREEISEAAPATVRSITAGCGKGISFINPLKMDYFKALEYGKEIRAGAISGLMGEFTKASELFKLTGGVHSAAWSDGEGILRVSEDIGRHNCVDKLTGWKLLNPEISRDAIMLISSGRISSDVVAKSLRAGAVFLISRSAPTTGAVQLAHRFGITMVGFTRGERFNIYTHPERIVE